MSLEYERQKFGLQKFGLQKFGPFTKNFAILGLNDLEFKNCKISLDFL